MSERCRERDRTSTVLQVERKRACQSASCGQTGGRMLGARCGRVSIVMVEVSRSQCRAFVKEGAALARSFGVVDVRRVLRNKEGSVSGSVCTAQQRAASKRTSHFLPAAAAGFKKAQKVAGRKSRLPVTAKMENPASSRHLWTVVFCDLNSFQRARIAHHICGCSMFQQ